MDRDLGLRVDWPTVKDRHTRLLQREPRPHTQRLTDGSSGPTPWTKEAKRATEASPQEQWTGASGSANPRH
eukprot:4583106-Pyramimonas_sp.AAC.1